MKFINRKTLINDSIMIVLGNLIYAFGVLAFIEQPHLVTGGVTGISIFLHYITGWSTSFYIAILNIVFFILGYFTLGKKFALGTLASTIIYPICVFILEFIPLEVFSFEDIWINVIFAGLTMGIGLGLVLRTGASTGGLDIPSLLIHKHFSFISIGVCVTLIDLISVFAQMFGGITLETVVYGIVIIAIYSYAIDKVILFGKNKVELKIVSKKQKEIRRVILHDLDRGVTLLHSKTGYLKEEVDTILTVVDVRELAKVQKVIYSIDPDAFIIISHVKEVKGRGFTLDKVYEEEGKEA